MLRSQKTKKMLLFNKKNSKNKKIVVNCQQYLLLTVNNIFLTNYQ